MLKWIVIATMAAASVTAASNAFADVSVNVGADTPHRHHHAVHHAHVYYSGSEAYVARDRGATIVHAYPGVDVYVGAGGDVNVNVGY